MVAKKQGWDPDKDVKIVGLGGLDAQLAALARKEIHAYVWGDGGAVTQLQGKSKVLMRLDTVTPKWISQIQYVSEDGIAKQADAIRKSQKRALPRDQAHARQPEGGRASSCPRRSAGARRPCWPPTRSRAPCCRSTAASTWRRWPSMQDTLLEHGLIKKKLPLEEHYTREFTPVRI